MLQNLKRHQIILRQWGFVANGENYISSQPAIHQYLIRHHAWQPNGLHFHWLMIQHMRNLD